jgi:uncharacterized protein (TIGR01777 family)
MRIVVTGGSGFLLAPLVGRLRTEVQDLVLLTRHPRRPGDLAWNPESPSEALATVIDGADAVVHFAGESIAGGRWTERRKAAIRDSRVRLTRALVEAILAARKPPTVLVSGSAVGFYGPHGDEVLTEASPPGEDFLAQVCRDWEGEAMAASSVTRVVTVRTGLALGRWGGALPPIARPFNWLLGGPFGSGSQYMSWIHQEDWAQLVYRALMDSSISGPINATAPSPVTNLEFARTLGRVLRRPALLRMPPSALRLVLGEMGEALLLNGQRVIPAKAESLDFTFRYQQLEPALRAIFN